MRRRALFLLSLFPGILAAQVTYERLALAAKEPQNWLTYSGTYIEPALQHARPDHARQREDSGTEVGLSGREPAEIRDHAAGRRRHHVPDPAAQRRGRARCRAPAAIFWIYSLQARADSQALLRRRESRPRDPRRHAFHGAPSTPTSSPSTPRTASRCGTPRSPSHDAGYAMTLAPLVVKDKVIVGVAGGEYGIRGFIAAYDARTGKEAWRFYTIPGPGEPGHETWPPAIPGRHGGASVWVTGSYDPDLNLTYWGIGNPGPDWNGDAAQGRQSLLRFAWSRSTPTPASSNGISSSRRTTPYDYDAVQVPVLADMQAGDGPPCAKLMLWANRNGFFYALDRTTGKFLSGQPFVKVNWASGLDDNGRPMRITPSARRGTPDLPRQCRAAPTGIRPPTAREPASSTSRPGKTTRRSLSAKSRSTRSGQRFVGGRPTSPIPGSPNPSLRPARHQHVDRSGGARLRDGARHPHRTEEMEVRHDGRNRFRNSDHGLGPAVHRRTRRLLSRPGCKNRSTAVEGERGRRGRRRAHYLSDRWQAVRGHRRRPRPLRLRAARVARPPGLRVVAQSARPAKAAKLAPTP